MPPIRWRKRLCVRRTRLGRMIGHRKINCSVVTCCEKLADCFPGVPHSAPAKLWHKLAGTAQRPPIARPRMGWRRQRVAPI